MDMIDLEAGTVVLFLFQDRVVVTLMGMGTLGVVVLMDAGSLGVGGLLGLKHTLQKETRCFLQVEEVPV